MSTALAEFKPEVIADSEAAASGQGGSDLVRILWRRKLLLFLGLSAGIVGGFLMYMQKRPVYESKAQLFVYKKKSINDSGQGDSRTQFVEDFVATQEALVKSFEIQSKAAAMLAKGGEYEIVEAPEKKEFMPYISNGLIVSRYRDSSTGAVSNVLNLAFRSYNPEDSKTAVNAIYGGYKEAISITIDQLQQEQLAESIRSLEKYRKDLDTLNNDLARIQTEATRVSPLSQTEINSIIFQNLSKRTALEDSVNKIKTRLDMIKASEKDQYSRRIMLMLIQSYDKENGVPSIDPSKAQNVNESIVALTVQLEEKVQFMGDAHPEVMALARRIAKLKELLNDRRDPLDADFRRDPLEIYNTYLNMQLKGEESFLGTLNKTLDKDQDTARQLSARAYEAQKIERSLTQLSTLIQETNARKTKIELAKDSPLYDAKLITPPEAGVKVAPVLLQYLLVAAFLGLLAGSGLAYLAEMTDRSFKSPDEIRRRLGAQVIGHIPVLHQFDGDQDPALEALDTKLISAFKPKSVESEAYRGVRTSLYFSLRGRGHQVIQVTSPNAGDGKSTLASNLAVSVAQSGRKVVLIDCDFRKPRVHKIFGLDKKDKGDLGLASVIMGECELFAAIQECEEIPGLSLLPCGPRPQNPAELLTTPKFQELLQRIRDEFEVVIIDTPPLLAVSDPSVVAPRVDGVILCLSISKYGRPAAERAREMLNSVGANLLGVVVNNSATGGGYGYGYGSTNYGYGYGSYGGYNYSEPYADTDGEVEGKGAPRLSHKPRPKG